MIKLLYPMDPTIRCIKHQAVRLSRLLEVQNKRVVIQPNDASRCYAHQEIETSTENDLLVFMGHGRSDALYGAKGKYYNAEGLTGDSALEDNPDLYNDQSFIDSSTYYLFAGKKVVCFTCNSNELGEKLVKAGAKVVLGFGRLPTTRPEFEEDWNVKAVNNHMVSAMSGILDVSFFRAFRRTVEIDGNFADLLYCIKNEFHWHIAMLLYSKARYRYTLANILYDVEKSVTIIGDSNLKLVENNY